MSAPPLISCRYVISELIESEKDYVERLRYCIEVCLFVRLSACLYIFVYLSVCEFVCVHIRANPPKVQNL